MAVGALQKARVRVPYQIRHCLLVHAGVEQGGHIVMAKRVQVIFLWKSNGLLDFPQPFGEGIRVNELPEGIREEIGTKFPMRQPGFQLFPPAVAQKDSSDIR